MKISPKDLKAGWRTEKMKKEKNVFKLNYDDDEWLWQIEISIFAMTADLCFDACKQIERRKFQIVRVQVNIEICDRAWNLLWIYSEFPQGKS